MSENQAQDINAQDINVQDVNVQDVHIRPVVISKHVNHPLCQELLGLIEQVDVNSATVTRGTKNPKQVMLITEKERELLGVFKKNGYNIKKTGEALGCSHTNVWQRLYGLERTNGKSIKGIVSKLRTYNLTQPEMIEEQIVEEQIIEEQINEVV